LTGTSLFAGNRGDGNLIAPVVLDAGSVLSNFMTTKNGLVVYPNPFSKELTINYTLTASNNVFVGIYNVLGKKLDVLVDNEMQQGQQALIWDGNTSDGNTVDQGVYCIHLQIGETNNVIRIIKE
jgi:flagellar hook assembly protein FlgD